MPLLPANIMQATAMALRLGSYSYSHTEVHLPRSWAGSFEHSDTVGTTSGKHQSSGRYQETRLDVVDDIEALVTDNIAVYLQHRAFPARSNRDWLPEQALSLISAILVGHVESDL